MGGRHTLFLLNGCSLFILFKMLPSLIATCYFSLLSCFLFVFKIVFGLQGSRLVHKNLFLTMVLGIIFLTTNHVQWTSPHANCPFHIF